MARQNKTIDLLPAEQLLRQLLLNCRNDMRSSDPLFKLEIWFVGGWVRDKLLGKQSSDIDIALSTMTGVQFGTILEDFFSDNAAKYKHEAQRHGVPPAFKGLHKIDRKPEKSKHLEAGTTQIFGLQVDFINLREEIYNEDSRNPQVEFGTAIEDACRRDATINAIFYNLDTQQIEDHTGKGLQDLAAGIIRTPLDPYQTFMDDPLRVLRLIRFSSWLGFIGFIIDREAQQSMKDARIHSALNRKISRERVGIEVGKMMNGPNPLMAFQLIYEMDLYSTVFLDPHDHLRGALLDVLPCQISDCPWPSTWPRAYTNLATLLEGNPGSLGEELAQSEDRESIWKMAAWAPIAQQRRTNIEDAVEGATRAIDATSKTSKLLSNALKNMDDIRSVIDLVADDRSRDNLARSTVGMAIRSWGMTWKLQVLYSLLAGVVSQPAEDESFAPQLGRYSKFVEFVLEQKLQDAPFIKPILNGGDVKNLFKLEKSGAFMKSVLDSLVQWQLDNKHGSRDEATEWLRARRESFSIP